MTRAFDAAARALEPPIADMSGYTIRASDLSLLKITPESVMRWRAGTAPLGLRPDEYEYFVHSLQQALRVEGVTTCDVRLKGSSTAFFSGLHKRMPWRREEIADCFRELRGRLPEKHELDYIVRALHRHWPRARKRPMQRPFDVLYHIKIDRSRSDLDLQLSSTEIDERARSYLSRLGLSVEQRSVASETYDFIRKDLFETVCGHLAAWAAHCSDVIGREVSIAAFPECGPPDRSEEVGALSSHFREADWCIAEVGDA